MVRTFLLICALLVTLTQQRLRAGWTGQMNGLGVGKTIVNVNSPVAGLGSATDSSSVGPSISAAMPVNSAFHSSAPLPNALTTTIAQSTGSQGYIWVKKLAPAGGDSTDNAEIQNRINIVPVDCPSIEVTTGVIYNDATEKSGYITVVANATAGTAVLLRGFEVLDGSGQPELGDYYDKTKGNLAWEILLVGPFNYTAGCPFKIPFVIQTDKSNLWFATDGVAVSKSFSITCPQNVSLPCGATTYPVSSIGGCGQSTISYSKMPNQLVPGVPTLVTATATDAKGDKVMCQFTATRAGLTGLLCSDVIFTCGSPLAYSPTPLNACGSVSYMYSVLPQNLSPGVLTPVTATAIDADGNSATCTFNALRQALNL